MSSKEVVEILKQKKMSISTMESCTGGHLIDLITNEEGSSSITEGGYVTYSNAQKIRMGVSQDVVEKYGVYSRETAQAMAEAVYLKMNTNISIGVSGTLSNVDPNNKDSVPGTVYYCIKANYENKEIDHLAEIKVPIMSRHKQKDYIAEIIFNDTASILKSVCINSLIRDGK